MSSDESEEEELHDDNLLASSDDDDDSEEEAAPAGDASKFMGGSGSDDESGESDDELPIERQARKLDDEAAKVQREDAEELKQQEQGLLAPDSDGEEDGADTRGDDGAPPIDLAAVQTRIHENVKILENFTAHKNDGSNSITMPRSEYLQQLTDDMAGYYGYLPYLIEKFLGLFSPSQTVEFLEANEVDRPVTIRTNTLRSRRKDLQQALQGRGMRVEPIDKWSSVGMVVYQSPVPIGATPEYLAGHYIIQSAASFLPCMALAPLPDERVLDMCAAPGGKASHLAAMMKNTGVLFANDSKRPRIKALNANLHRLGVTNSVITNYDGRAFPQVMRGFDRCLLDAPCTGLGVIAKDPGVKMQRDEDQLLKLSHLQKELLLAAIDCVDADSKSGGIVVYSTCSVSVEENEAVVDYALKNRGVKLVESGLEFGVPGFCRWRKYRFHPSVALTRRYYPHTHNMDGFYVAKFKKFSNAVGPAAGGGAEPAPVVPRQFGKLSKKVKRKRKEAADAAEEEEYSADVPLRPKKQSPEEVAAAKEERKAARTKAKKAARAARAAEAGGAALMEVEEVPADAPATKKRKKQAKGKAAKKVADSPVAMDEEPASEASKAPPSFSSLASPKAVEGSGKKKPKKKSSKAAEPAASPAVTEPAEEAAAQTSAKKKKKTKKVELASAVSAEVAEEVGSMSYRDMQKAAKGLGRTKSGNHQLVKAAGKADELKANLTDALKTKKKAAAKPAGSPAASPVVGSGKKKKKKRKGSISIAQE